MKGSRKRGYTLVELTIAGTMTAVVGGALLVASQGLSDAFETGTSTVTLEGAARQSIDRAATLLEAAGTGTLVPPSMVGPFSASSVDFQRPVDFVADAIVWGDLERIAFEGSPLDPPDGVDNDGNGLVDEGRLVWIERVDQLDEERHVLVSNVSRSLEGEIDGNGLDDNGNGLIDELGFAATWLERRMVVRISVERRVAAERRLVRTVERTLFLTN